MWRVVTCLAALALCSCQQGTRSTRGDEGRAPQADLPKDEPELFYSLGILAAQLVSTYELTPEEMTFVEAGLEARLTGAAPPVEDEAADEVFSTLREQAESRAQARTQAQNNALLEQAAKEEGAVKLESGGIFRSLEEGSGPAPTSTDKLELHTKSMFADGTQIFDTHELGRTQWLDLETLQEPRCLVEGLRRVKQGGRARLLCPPEEGLSVWMGGVAPPDAMALLEVHVVAVVPPEPPPVAKPEPLPPPVYHHVDVPADAPFSGPKNAKVTVVVWLSPCQECGGLEVPMKRLREKYPQDVRLVLRLHFKPEDIEWRRAAEAILAAHAQGRAWEYYEKLLEWPASSHDRRMQIARGLKLDMDRFEEAMNFRLFRARAETEGAAGRALGLDGEGLALFVNGREVSEVPREHPGARRRLPSDEVLDQIIQEEKARAERLLAAGTPRSQLYSRLIAGGQKPAPLPAPTETGMEHFDLRHSPARGPATAPVTLVLFANFQDAASAERVPRFRWLEREYAGKLRLVFKNLPSPQHPQARGAALAALAAHEQGRFWDYHDRLFAHQDALDDEALLRHARHLGLDERRFQEALGSGRLERWLETDEREARWLELQSTPVIYLNRRPLYSTSISQLRKWIDAELKRKKK